MEQISVTTYLSIAQNLFAENPKFYKKADQKAILSFAKYLDSGRELGPDLQILALKQARKIDGEVLEACVKRFGLDAMKEVVGEVYAKHKHTRAIH